VPHYTHLIVGGGMTADAAVGGIREVDAHGSVGLIGAEAHPPYDRPPLSKGLWKGKPLEGIWRKAGGPGGDPSPRPGGKDARPADQECDR
jgi:3-phenylpropionate/trans-cinnamate dioxygenase ferredoxin reductase component